MPIPLILGICARVRARRTTKKQGLDLYFYLENATQVGVWSAQADTANYEITDVKYVAHEVNLDDAFVNQMKGSMSSIVRGIPLIPIRNR